MRILILLISFVLVFNNAYAGDDEEAAPPAIEYLEMKPKFTVNLDKPKKYLAVKVQLMVEGEENITEIKKHLPALRHEIIMLYSGRASAELQTMEQREALRQETKTAITEALDKLSGQKSLSKGLGEVFFTEFLIN